MSRVITTLLLVVGSNAFMTWARYGHLRKAAWSIPFAIGIAWLIALPGSTLQAPANRLGHVLRGGPFTALQRKILQEAITPVVFTVFAIAVLGERPRPTDCVALAAVAVSMAGRGGG